MIPPYFIFFQFRKKSSKLPSHYAIMYTRSRLVHVIQYFYQARLNKSTELHG
jgi:hypothetical protein